MLFDLDLIRTVYGTFANRVDAARKAAGTPLTLTEKILYAHLRCRTRRRRWRCCNS